MVIVELFSERVAAVKSAARAGFSARESGCQHSVSIRGKVEEEGWRLRLKLRSVARKRRLSATREGLLNACSSRHARLRR
jgi:hypothetical protein